MDIKTNWTRRFFRFGLKTFFVVTTVFCVWFGVLKTQADRQASVVERVRHLYGHCRYDFEFSKSGKYDPAGESDVPRFLLNLLGVDFFHDVVEVQLFRSDKHQYGFILDGGSIRVFDNTPRYFGTGALENATEVIDDLLTLESLRIVSLPAMEDLDSIFEDRLSKLKHLEKITILRGGDLTDRGIASLKDLKKLKSISIEGTKIGDASLEVFGDMKQMEFLYLSGHAFSDDGVEQLAGLDELGFLCIDGPKPKLNLGLMSFFSSAKRDTSATSEVSDKSLKELLRLKKLRVLSVFRTQTTDAMGGEFQARIPGIRVIQ